MLFKLVLRSVVRQSHSKMSSYSLIYKQFGDPNQVVELAELSQDVSGAKLSANNVLVKILAAPINPADLNTIQGTYAVKPMLPAVGGNEAVAEVVAVGSDVKSMGPGDWVIPAQAGSGTWQTHSTAPEKFFIKIDRTGLDVLAAAQLTVNPCTAYRMLKDFEKLEPGATVLQNGANSAVGLNVIQLSKAWGLKTINVIRKRPNDDHDKMVKKLTDLGAHFVVTEEDLRDREKMGSIFKHVPRPKLALNCVGGKNATDCIRQLDEKGTMVTYGGMSKQPLVVPTGSLIFRDQRFVGYWMTRWSLIRDPHGPERTEMLSEIVELLKSGSLQSPKAIEFSLQQYKMALATATGSSFVEGKPVFVIN